MKETKELMYLTEAMQKMNKKLELGTINIINSQAGSGKTRFIFDELIMNTTKYTDMKYNLIADLNKVIYVCDTTMLKDSVIANDEKNMLKIYEKGDLKKAIETATIDNLLEGGGDYIKVITYAGLIYLLNSDYNKKILSKYIRCFIFDEMHNLFKYAIFHDKNTKNIDERYSRVIDFLEELMSTKVLLIALTATPGIIYSKLRNRNIEYRTLFGEDEKKSIKHYTQILEKKFYNCSNLIKELHILKYMRLGKVLLYTTRVDVANKYKNLFKNFGYNAEWICSVNNKIQTKNNEKISRMNKKQLDLRDTLLRTNQIPKDLDVLIINAAYETGWDLENKDIKDIQIVIVDTTDEDVIIQARNRIRHDIKLLCYKPIIDSNLEIYEYDIYRNLIPTEKFISISYLASNIEEKYIGTKLTAKDRKYLVEKYAIVPPNKRNATWKTFKYDLERCDFIVKEINKKIYIFREGEEIVKDNKIKIKKDKNMNILEEWLLNEWDKVRIKCKDVIDELGISRRSWDNLKNNDDFLEDLKVNGIKISEVKGAGKALYFIKL